AICFNILFRVEAIGRPSEHALKDLVDEQEARVCFVQPLLRERGQARDESAEDFGRRTSIHAACIVAHVPAGGKRALQVRTGPPIDATHERAAPLYPRTTAMT